VNQRVVVVAMTLKFNKLENEKVKFNIICCVVVLVKKIKTIKLFSERNGL